MILTPAFGRDYKSKKALLADFDADKDFVIADVFGGNYGRYVNKSQLVGIENSVNIRYCKLQKVAVIKL